MKNYLISAIVGFNNTDIEVRASDDQEALDKAYEALEFNDRVNCEGFDIISVTDIEPVAKLVVSEDSFDQNNTFAMIVKGYKGPKRIWASLQQDYDKPGDGVYWAMKQSAVLKSSYSDKDVEERNRLNSMQAIQDGDIVSIDGKLFKVDVLGDFSNAALFEAI